MHENVPLWKYFASDMMGQTSCGKEKGKKKECVLSILNEGAFLNLNWVMVLVASNQYFTTPCVQLRWKVVLAA